MRGFTAKLLATTAIPTIAVLTLPSLAWATCATPAANGDTIACDVVAEDTDGLDSGGFTGLTVNVAGGAVVSNTNAAPAISLLDGTVTVGAGAQIGGNTPLGVTAANTDGINITGAGTVNVGTGGIINGLAGSAITIGSGTVNIQTGNTITGTGADAINITGAGTLTTALGTTISTTNGNGINVGSGSVTSDSTITVTGDATVTGPIAGIRDANGDVTTSTAGGSVSVTLNSSGIATNRDIYSGYTGDPAAIGIYAGTGSNPTVNTVNNANVIGVTTTGNNNVGIGMEGSGDTQLQNYGQITVNQSGGTGGIAIGMNASTDGMLNASGAQINITLDQNTAVSPVAPNAYQGANGTAIGMRIFNAAGVTPPTGPNDNLGAIGITIGGSNGLAVGIAIDSSLADLNNQGSITITDNSSSNTLIGIRGTPVSGTNNLLITNSTTGSILIGAGANSSATGIVAGGDASVVNDGTITINAGASTSSAIGVDLSSSGTFDNTGTINITGGSSVIGARINSTVAQQSFTNNGTITVSGTSAIGADIGLGTMVNNGTITSTGGTGIRINPQLDGHRRPDRHQRRDPTISATGTALLSQNTSGFASPLARQSGR